MRIAFLGKGGAGKTTTSAGFIQYLAKRHPFVLAVDADLNAHLKSALSIEAEVDQLGLHFDEVVTFLRGSRTDLGERPMIGTTPPAAGGTCRRQALRSPVWGHQNSSASQFMTQSAPRLAARRAIAVTQIAWSWV